MGLKIGIVEGDGQHELKAHFSHLSQKFQTGLPFSISGQQSKEDLLPPGVYLQARWCCKRNDLFHRASGIENTNLT